MSRAVVATKVVLGVASLILAGSAAAVAAGETYADLDAEFGLEVEAFMQAYRDAANDQEREALLEDPTREPRQAFTPRFAAAAEAERGRDKAVPFLVWLVRNGTIAQRGVGDAAVATLFADHLDSPGLDRLPAALYSVRGVRGLETTLEDLERLAEASKEPTTRDRTDFYRARGLAAFGAVAEARAIFEKLVTRADAETSAEASTKLGELSHPILGGPAPPLIGDLASGDALEGDELSGKVVLVDFWGMWCGPCIAQLPELRAIHERFAPQGLVVIGVDSDDDLERLATFLQENDIGWRQLLDGSTSGPIAEAWRVRSWPKSFLVDGHGVVRYADLTGEELEQGIEKLLGESSAN